MNTELQQSLASNTQGVWVTLDVAMEALDLGRSKVYALAKSEGWRKAPGTRPAQYNFTDIRATYRRLRNIQERNR